MSSEEAIRQLISAHARLPITVEQLSVHDDLFQKGMTSHASVNLMLAIEEQFDIEFPNSMLRKSTFETIAAIQDAVQSLVVVATK